jgi:hypothetical protein
MVIDAYKRKRERGISHISALGKIAVLALAHQL